MALSEDLATFDTERELVVFDAGTEATLGEPSHQNFLAEHMLIAFGKPGGIQLGDGDLLVYFLVYHPGRNAHPLGAAERGLSGAVMPTDLATRRTAARISPRRRILLRDISRPLKPSLSQKKTPAIRTARRLFT